MKYSRRNALAFGAGAAGLLLSGCNSPTTASMGSQGKGSVTLRAVTGQNGDDAQMMGIHRFKEKVEEMTRGRIQIDYLGGPEVVPAFVQGEAIQSGAVDLSWTFSSYYAHLVPEALALTYSTREYLDEIEHGSIDYLNSVHERRANIHLVGRGLPAKFTIYVSDPQFTSTSDFAGKTFRGTATYLPLLEALGAETLSLPGGEIYTALDRGIIEGFAWGEIGISTLGVERLIGGQLLPTFFQNDQVVIGNKDAWDQLSPQDRDLLDQAIVDVFYELEADVQDHRDAESELLADNGVGTIELTDAAEFLEIGVDASWEWLATRVEDIDALADRFKETIR